MTGKESSDRTNDRKYVESIDPKNRKPRRVRPVAVVVLITLEAILAFLGLFSGGSFLYDPSGASHGMDTSILENTPVGDFTLVGLFFVTAYGILPILAIVGLWKLPRWHWTDAVNRWTGQNWGWTATAATGIILIVWIAVEIAYIGSPDGFPRFLQITMALDGIVILGLAVLPRTRAYAKIEDAGRTSYTDASSASGQTE